MAKGLTRSGPFMQASQLALEEAHRTLHRYVEPAHLLLAALRVERSVAARALPALGISYETLRQVLDSGVDELARGDVHGYVDKLSASTRKLVGLAADAARARHDNYLGTEHLLLAIVLEPSLAGSVLQRAGLSPTALDEWLGDNLAVCSEKPSLAERVTRTIPGNWWPLALFLLLGLSIGLLSLWAVLGGFRREACPVNGGQVIRDTLVLRGHVAATYCRLGGGQLEALALGAWTGTFELLLPEGEYRITYGVEPSSGGAGQEGTLRIRARRRDRTGTEALVLVNRTISGGGTTIGDVMHTVTGDVLQISVEVEGYTDSRTDWRLEFARP